MTISGAAVVTGGARGIGEACVLALAEAGYPVVVADLDEAGADVASIVVAGGGRARFVRTDVTSIDDIRALMEFAETAFGCLQVLVNNAAITRVIDLFDLTMDDWDEVLRVNARGSFFAMQEAAPADGGFRRRKHHQHGVDRCEGIPRDVQHRVRGLKGRDRHDDADRGSASRSGEHQGQRGVPWNDQDADVGHMGRRACRPDRPGPGRACGPSWSRGLRSDG